MTEDQGKYPKTNGKPNPCTDPRADAAARGLAFSREQASYIGHHARNVAQALNCAGRRRLRDVADGCVVRLTALAQTVEDLAQADAPSPPHVWDAAVAIAGEWLDVVTVDPGTIHRLARSTTGGPGPDAERPRLYAEIRVQLLNDKPRTVCIHKYSSTTLASALEHLRTCLPGDFEKFQERYGRASHHGATEDTENTEDGGHQGDGK